MMVLWKVDRFCTVLMWLNTFNQAFQRYNNPSVKLVLRQFSSRLYFQSKDGGSDDNSDLTLINSKDINQLISDLPMTDKYQLLLQSFSSKILDSSSKDGSVLQNMEDLFSEMLSKSISPDDKTVQSFVDSAASFCNVQKITTALKLLKQGGRLKAFGAIISQLTIPTLKASDSTLTSIKLPVDEREKEVSLAIAVAGIVFGWFLLQIGCLFIDEVHPWASLYGCIMAFAVGFDIFLRKGIDLRQATHGIERLILRDESRQSFVDAAGFLTGYMLGLPCFCYKPDVIEALKMLEEYPASLTAYQQQTFRNSNFRQSSSQLQQRDSNSQIKFENALNEKKNAIQKSPTTNTVNVDAKPPSSNNIQTSSKEVALSNEAQIFNLGRVLIWLMAPVAAESMKYGSSVISDPRRGKQLLSALDKPLLTPFTSQGSSTSKTLASIVPKDVADRIALLEWAYFEATTLVRQYGDLLEELEAYLRTGTSTVGECTILLESELT